MKFKKIDTITDWTSNRRRNINPFLVITKGVLNSSCVSHNNKMYHKMLQIIWKYFIKKKKKKKWITYEGEHFVEYLIIS